MPEAEPVRQRLLKIPETIHFGITMSGILKGVSRGSVICEAAQSWLESGSELFDYLDEPRTQTLLRTPEELDSGMRIAAAELDTSVNAVYYSACVGWLIEQSNDGFNIARELESRREAFLPKLDILTRK